MRVQSILKFLTISLSVTRAVSGEHKRTPNQTTLLDGDGSIIQPLSALDLEKQQAVLGVETRELEEEHIALIHAITENQPDIATKILERILERTDVGIEGQDKDGYTALMVAIDENQPKIAIFQRTLPKTIPK